MKLSTKTRYGTRAMVELAVAYPDAEMSVKEIAKRQRLSVKYLEQIMMPLKSAGLVKSSRGVHGGYALTRPPSEIRLSEIYTAVEGPLAIIECLKESVGCQMREVCPTQRVWRRMNAAIAGVLEDTTLADLAGVPEAQPSR